MSGDEKDMARANRGETGQQRTVPGEELHASICQQVHLAPHAIVFELCKEFAAKLAQRIGDALADLGQHWLERNACTAKMQPSSLPWHNSSSMESTTCQCTPYSILDVHSQIQLCPGSQEKTWGQVSGLRVPYLQSACSGD